MSKVYQTYTSAHPFDTLVAGLVVAEEVLSQTSKGILKNPKNLFMRPSKYLLRVILEGCLALVVKRHNGEILLN